MPGSTIDVQRIVLSRALGIGRRNRTTGEG
jgi:hypothetical protein